MIRYFPKEEIWMVNSHEKVLIFTFFQENANQKNNEIWHTDQNSINQEDWKQSMLMKDPLFTAGQNVKVRYHRLMIDIMVND